MQFCRSRLRPGLTLALVPLGVLIAAPRAEAHGLGAQCKRNGDRIELEAYYDDDTPAAEAKVSVEDGNKKIIAEGWTDTRGRWSFVCPPPARYLVVVDAGAGHRKVLRISIPAGEGPNATTPGENAAVAITVSDEPSRAEFTSFQWLKIGIGLAVIGGIGLAFWISRYVAHAGSAGER
jgi:nickel transport protein